MKYDRHPSVPTNPKARLLWGNELVGEIFTLYPDKLDPHPFVPTRTEVLHLIDVGVDPAELLQAARNYRAECDLEPSNKKWRIGPVRFYRDGIWRRYLVPTVWGRTREEWALSGQDVAEFDRLVKGGTATTPDDPFA